MIINKLRLRPLRDADIELMTRWLNKDYIKKWYNDPQDWLTEIKGRHGEYSWLKHFIVIDDEMPIGFCQYYDCFDAGSMEDWYDVDEPGHTFSIDYLIGNEAYLGKSWGKAIVRLLTETVGESEAAKRIIVQPDTENHASNHVLMANGYLYDEAEEYYSLMLD